mmetsp:Transcript_105951/g.265337  ORF Transcript_105951/g.265337 Transcript_105951/m.265337 type:complete len:248 (-) Transcript_105951:493-1236(-)
MWPAALQYSLARAGPRRLGGRGGGGRDSHAHCASIGALFAVWLHRATAPRGARHGDASLRARGRWRTRGARAGRSRRRTAAVTVEGGAELRSRADLAAARSANHQARPREGRRRGRQEYRGLADVGQARRQALRGLRHGHRLGVALRGADGEGGLRDPCLRLHSGSGQPRGGGQVLHLPQLVHRRAGRRLQRGQRLPPRQAGWCAVQEALGDHAAARPRLGGRPQVRHRGFRVEALRERDLGPEDLA